MQSPESISYLTQREAAEIDETLMGPLGFSVDQLMVSLSAFSSLSFIYFFLFFSFLFFFFLFDLSIFSFIWGRKFIGFGLVFFFLFFFGHCRNWLV